MAVVSIRFTDEPLHGRLKDRARRSRTSVSSLAERLIDEGLRTEAHPAVIFRDGPAGRRPVMVGGPDLIDVVGAIVGGDVPTDERRERAAKMLGVTVGLVDAAMAYYAEFTDEVDQLITELVNEAEASETAWRRQQELLGR